ncbi:MAG: tRNA pseudouridine(38-40) synthase TruA [Deltaproteobacteria bacterium]|nr:tRNA pseudouridine(38-40) synthase TruA [Deltaproteobacteria bacterium]
MAVEPKLTTPSPLLSRTPCTYKVVLAYDGAAFHGVIRQPGLRTVGEEFQRALEDAAGQRAVALCYAARTDTGVHALGQVASFRLGEPVPVHDLLPRVRARLPPDIRLRGAEEVPRSFHARASAVEKLYRYRFARGAVPPGVARRAWVVAPALDLGVMAQLARGLTGTHDFTALSHPRSSGGTVKTVRCIRLRRRATAWGEVILVDVVGDGFLRQMVRRMAATLALCGSGWFPVEHVLSTLAGAQRRGLGPAAPPQGLTLVRVTY